LPIDDKSGVSIGIGPDSSDSHKPSQEANPIEEPKPEVNPEQLKPEFDQEKPKPESGIEELKPEANLDESKPGVGINPCI